MYYYVTHWIWLCIYEAIFADYMGWEKDSQYYFIFMVLSSLLILPIIYRIFKNYEVFKKMLGYR